jgi:hypothetical protein
MKTLRRVVFGFVLSLSIFGCSKKEPTEAPQPAELAHDG